MDGLFAFLGAFVGGVAAGLVNWFLIDKQHRHAKELQDRQFAQAERDRELEQRNARGNQIAEWDYQRQDREQERGVVRQAESDREQRDIWRELNLIVPRFMFAAKWIYQRKLDLYRKHKETGRDEFLEDKSQEARETMTQFNELRERLRILQAQLLDEKVRTATAVIRTIGIDMVETNPMFWVESKSFYGSHDPLGLIYPRVGQLEDMLGRLLRGDNIDDVVVVLNATEIPVERGRD
jgi:hypothetical protein